MTSPEYAPHDVRWTPEKVDRFWGFEAAGAGRDLFFSAHSGAAVVRRIDREIGLRGKRVLDFGCGRGDLLAHLFARGIAASGLELSAGAARETEARFAGEPLFGGVTLAAGFPSSLADGSFDVVLLVEVVEHLLEEQIGPTLAEVRRVLVPGGFAVATTPCQENLANEVVRCPDCGATFHRWQHQRSFSAETLAGLFERHGFQTRLAEDVYWYERPLSRLVDRLRHPFERMVKPHLVYIGLRTED